MAHFDWAQLYGGLSNCTACTLHKNRRSIVVGDGNPNADIMLIGEGPGHDEDVKGIPFVGPAGQLLDKMLFSIGLDRRCVYIANIVKCRPPANRTPLEDEAKACLPFLRAQVALVRPKIIVCLGRTAAAYVYDPEIRISRDRGTWRIRKGIWILPTFHPSALLRDPSKKKQAWQDMQSLRDKCKELGIGNTSA